MSLSSDLYKRYKHSCFGSLRISHGGCTCWVPFVFIQRCNMSIKQESKEEFKEVVKEVVRGQVREMKEEMEAMTRRIREEKKWEREREEMRNRIEELERGQKEGEREGKKEREGKSNNENVGYQEEERVVIDAVHERFRRRDNIMNNYYQMYIQCDDCDSRILWDNVAIRNHFNNFHPSNKHCRYCKGKVFIYRKVIIVDGNETSDEIVYHKCDYNQQAEISA